MTAKHSDPLYRKNARIIRQQVARARRLGDEVLCGRCGWPIDPEQQFDVGHRDERAGHELENLAPEHRYKTGRCRGNRSAGGTLGQRIQAARAQKTRGLLPW